MNEPLTVQAVVAAYLRHCAADNVHSPEAREERERTLGLFVADFGRFAVEQCRAFHLSDWIESQPRWKSSSTRKAKANQVNAAFNWAVRGGRLDKNPFAGVNYRESEPRQPMPDPVIENVCAKSNKAYERIVRFLRLTACRLSELCGLLWPDVDFIRGVIIIRNHKSRKRTGHAKTVVLIQEAIDFLTELRKQNPESTGHVFLNNRGTAWNRGTLGQQLRRMKSRGQVETDATLHGIRHEAASACLRNGASINLVSHMLGHADITITRKFYDHTATDIEAIRAAAEKGRPHG